MGKFLKENINVLVLAVLFCLYVFFNETKEPKTNIYKVESTKIINEDSIINSIYNKNRLFLDSIRLNNNKRIDSLGVIIRKEYREINKIEKRIDHINSIIGELPDL